MQEFEPDQLVLVQYGNGGQWRLRRYSVSCDKGKGHETQDGVVWPDDCIIPYSGNEHLLGTTDSPTPKWEPRPGELVAVCDEERDWTVCMYEETDDMFFWCKSTIHSDPEPWKFCEPLRKHFTIPEE